MSPRRSCSHFQLTTTCSQLVPSLLEASLQHAPVLTRIRTISNTSNSYFPIARLVTAYADDKTSLTQKGNMLANHAAANA